MSTRDKLIEAARELLWDKGYVATSPRDIQKYADVGQGSMYHHFSGKEELAYEAIKKSADVLKKAAEKDMISSGPVYNRVAAYINRDRNIMQGCRMGRLTQDHDVMKSEILRQPISESFEWIIGKIASLLKEGIENGELIEIDHVEVASAIIAAIQGGYILARAMNSEKPYHDAISGIGILLDGIRKEQKS